MQIETSSGRHGKSNARGAAVSALFAAAVITVTATPASADAQPADTRPAATSAQPQTAEAPCFGSLLDPIFEELSGGACG